MPNKVRVYILKYAAATGVIFALFFCAQTVLSEHTSWYHALKGSITAAVLMTIWTGFFTRHQMQDSTRMMADLSEGQADAAVKAAVTGVPPDDPALLPYAREFIYHQMDNDSRWNRVGMLLTGGALLYCAVETFTDSRWYVIGVVLVISAAIDIWWKRPRSFHRRLAALGGPDEV